MTKKYHKFYPHSPDYKLFDVYAENIDRQRIPLESLDQMPEFHDYLLKKERMAKVNKKKKWFEENPIQLLPRD